MNVPKLKSSKELTVLIYILWCVDIPTVDFGCFYLVGTLLNSDRGTAPAINLLPLGIS